MRIYKGIDLLEMILEFTEMTPETKNWSVNALQKDKSRLIRFKRINSLINAFFQDNKEKSIIEKTKKFFFENKKENIKTIISGDFLIRQKIEYYSELILFMKSTKHSVNVNYEREIHLGELIMPFQQLFKYKRKLRNLIQFNSGWIEASSLTSRFSIEITNSISNNLTDKFSDLDKSLELFINPNNQSFSEEVLVKSFNFPTDNLLDIDCENW